MVTMGRLLTFLLCISLFEGWIVQAVRYDHSASIKCLGNPTRALYEGGIIENSEFDSGLTGWTVPWGVRANVSSSPSGNNFASATSNNGRPSRSILQKIQMEADHHYSLSAWLQVSSGTAVVKAIFKTPNGDFILGGSTVAKSGCWSMLKGGMTSHSSGPGELFFETDGVVDIWVDSVAVQPFSFPEWENDRRLSSDNVRKSAVKVVARGAEGAPLPNANVSIKLLRPGFPFGNAMTSEILRILAYEEWFASRFTVTSFENELKWYSTERIENHEDYSVPDAMLRLAQKHGIQVRGHNVFWDTNDTQLAWVKPLGGQQLEAAMRKRLTSVVSRYAGKVIAWDVMNENLHGEYFETRLGPNASCKAYQQVAQIDTTARLFMNEYNTLEEPTEIAAMSSKYVAKMRQIRSYPGNRGLKFAVGLESHFGIPNIPYMRATLDMLAQLKVPIWLTEVDVSPKTAGPKVPDYLEEVLREGYGHPNVKGIVMWAAWHAQGCWVMCLTDNNFNNLPAGDRVDKLIAEWRTHPEAATMDANGVAELGLVHGEYNFTVTHPSLDSPVVRTLTVDASSSAVDHTIDIKV